MGVQPSLMGLVWEGTSAGPMHIHFPSLLGFSFIFKDLFGAVPRSLLLMIPRSNVRNDPLSSVSSRNIIQVCSF
jgi:hypothetical protein